MAKRLACSDSRMDRPTGSCKPAGRRPAPDISRIRLDFHIVGMDTAAPVVALR